MGHLGSKHKQMDLSSLPQGRISFSEDVPQQYSSQGSAGLQAIQVNGSNSEISINLEWETSRHQNSRNERKSIYSTMDRVPHFEFYTNSIGQQRRSRPSLEILRKVSEVSNLSVSLIDPFEPPRSSNRSRLILCTIVYTTKD